MIIALDAPMPSSFSNTDSQWQSDVWTWTYSLINHIKIYIRCYFTWPHTKFLTQSSSNFSVQVNPILLDRTPLSCLRNASAISQTMTSALMNRSTALLIGARVESETCVRSHLRAWCTSIFRFLMAKSEWVIISTVMNNWAPNYRWGIRHNGESKLP